MRKLLMLLLAVILLAAVGCGGGSVITGTDGPDDGLVTDDSGMFPGLPAIPADDPADADYREVSALTYGEREVDVLDPYAKWRVWEANLYGTVPCLGLAGADHWEAEGGWGVEPLFAYALYKVTHVDRPDLDRQLKHLVLETSAYDNGSPEGMGDEYWLGLANFDTHMWEWLGPGNGIPEYEVDLGELDYDFTSELGNLYFIVVVMPENLIYLRNACVLYTEGEEEPVEPDRPELCYFREYNGELGLWIMDLETRTQTRLVSLVSPRNGTAWSPDGSRIAFASKEFGDTTWQIYVINIDGSGLTRVTAETTHDGARDPYWQDHDTIIYGVQHYSETYLARIDLDGTSRQRLSPAGSGNYTNPFLSPDGTQIVYSNVEPYTTNGAICLANYPSFTGITELVDVPAAADFSPAWSSTDEVVFCAQDVADVRSLYKVALPETTPVKLSAVGVHEHYPRVSPAGDQVIYIRGSGTNSNIWLMNADGSNPELVEDEGSFWALDWYVPRESNGGGSNLIYAEDFSSDPGFELSDEVRLGDGDNPRWEDCVYKIYLKEYGPGANKFAMTPIFADLADQSFSVQFDLRYVSSSWGMGMNIWWVPDDVGPKGDPEPYGLAMQLRDHHSWSNRGALYMYDHSGNYTGYTPRTDTSQWYTVFGEYDHAAGMFDFVVTEQGTDVVFYEEYDVPMSPATFNRIAFGASTKNWDGSAAEMHIDNIFVYGI